MIKLGVIGCGSHALQSHILPARELGFKLAAVVDSSDDSIELVEAKTGLRASTPKKSAGHFVRHASARELLADPGIEAVLIASPDETHAQLLSATVQAGKPVLCEKPLAINVRSLGQLRESLRLASVQNVPVMSCHPRREPVSEPGYPYEWAKRQLSALQETYGQLSHVQLDFSYKKPRSPWKSQRSLLADHFPHEVDFLLWLFGSVSLEARRLHDSPSRYSVSGVVNDQITFLCMGTRSLDEECYDETVTFRFERATVIIHARTGYVNTFEHAGSPSGLLKSIQKIDYDARHVYVMEQFKHLVEKGTYDAEMANHLLRVATHTVDLMLPAGVTWISVK